MKRPEVEDLMLLSGLACITIGLWWLLPALSLVVLGILLMVGALQIARKKAPVETEP